jgi:tRNA-dihydrouridine synthase
MRAIFYPSFLIQYNTMNFWQELPKPFFILAPMEAVTDVVFRHVIAKAAKPDLFFTEFTNASSFCSPAGVHSTRGRLAFTDDEQPMVAQIWGSKPEEFREMAKGLKGMGFKGVDINMGCPDKSVIKTGAGSGLIRTPETAAELIAAAKESGLPLSVKTRLGYSSTDEWKAWLTHILKQDIVNLTVHLRTRKEMSKVDAHYELIPEIKKLRDEIAPHTLLTINGDIRDRTHGMELVEKYGIDGVMIGRGIFTNPFAFEKSSLPMQPPVVKESLDQPNAIGRPLAAHKVQGRTGNDDLDQKKHSQQELLDLLSLHLDLFDKYSEELEPRRFEPLKRFFKIYVRDFPGASELREKLMHTKSTDEVRALLSPSLSLGGEKK